ncbi:GPW/gp25 family protein [Streptomyces sp. AV19]|uniref:GPW/gp25 family protein n=1 Tax=Streptomyces sp. AV19 TaxID=2793068 RepID=UPI0018FE2E66|nr:GPW/gp25 family protein [Streptomyces sp. AV19]MBH1934408.1 GPW/gp25 family protein [Streptomyces sp. AV19]MDG4536262.1 GPW/gp25 family protein [Streptomyces sp. AV19]
MDRVGTDVIGAGWAFPAALTPSGEVALATGGEDVAQAIRLVLGTTPGERPMRPEFGCGVHGLAFDPLDATTVARADAEVRRALERWEPRIELDDLLFSTDSTDEGVLYIDVRYRLRDTNEPRNLVFPFYTLPQEG